MKKIISILAMILVSSAVFAATPPPQPKLEMIGYTPLGMFKHQAFLYRQAISNPGGGIDKAIFIIDLWGDTQSDKNAKNSLETYKVMGRQYGYLLSHLPPEYQNLSLASFYKELHARTYEKEGWPLSKLYDKIADLSVGDKDKDGKYIDNGRIPAREMELIQGAAETSALGVKDLAFLDQMFLFTFLTHILPAQSQELQENIFERPVNWQTVPEDMIPFGCSTLAVWGKYLADDNDNNMLFARNFDWTKNLHSSFANRTLITVLHPDNGDHSIALIGYPGWFFSDTAINDKGVLVEMNSGWYSSYTMNITKKTKGYADLLSDFLYTADNYASLKKLVADEKTNIPDIGYVIIGTDGATTTATDGTKTKNIFAAEETAPGILVKQHVRLRTPYSDIEPLYKDIDKQNEDVLAVSNSFRLPGWDSWEYIKLQVFPFPYPTKDDTSSYPLTRYNNLLHQARINKGNINLETMKNIMTRSLMDSDQGSATGYALKPDASKSKAEAVTYFSLVAAPDENHKLFNWWLRLPVDEVINQQKYSNQCEEGYKCDGHEGEWVYVDLNQFFK
ncbi:MAG: hypothetical protein M1561_00160 [Gammaproteobacteria bacterium]|nr:hypothetical protein [Gammaproteobacteria bacterium]